MLTISDNCFKKHGKSFFYLADTCWSAFTSISLEEWDEYLNYRKSQNFNVIQINILPQWDRSFPDLGIRPFEQNADGKYNFYKINTAYFERAALMLEKADDLGFTPALVILWGNYVIDTWMSQNNPSDIMPLDAMEAYVKYILKIFSRFDPVYLVSGDTDFRSDKTIQYYNSALEIIKNYSPDVLTTMHLTCSLTELPESLEKLGMIDFFMYQSGHRLEEQYFPYTMAETIRNNNSKRPIINGEPCYEGHGYGDKYGRFNEFDIRKATWQALLSGAKAGVTYGAHGIWSWHNNGDEFLSEGFSQMPYDWRSALKLKGAWEVSFAKWIFDTYQLFDIEPSKIILNKTQEIKAAISNDKKKVVIYVPYNTNVKINMDVTQYNWSIINLQEKLFACPEVVFEEGISTIKMNAFNSDILLIGNM